MYDRRDRLSGLSQDGRHRRRQTVRSLFRKRILHASDHDTHESTGFYSKANFHISFRALVSEETVRRRRIVAHRGRRTARQLNVGRRCF